MINTQLVNTGTFFFFKQMQRKLINVRTAAIEIPIRDARFTPSFHSPPIPANVCSSVLGGNDGAGLGAGFPRTVHILLI